MKILYYIAVIITVICALVAIFSFSAIVVDMGCYFLDYNLLSKEVARHMFGYLILSGLGATIFSVIASITDDY